MIDGLRRQIGAVGLNAIKGLLAAGLLLTMSFPAAAQPSDGEVLAALHDEDYTVRQAETRRLLSDHTLSPADLDRLFQASASLEQQNRLLRIARHHVIRRMIEDRFGGEDGPGSMGLSHHVVRITGPDGESERVGVMVVMTLPGFPAYEKLEPGDVILRFADQPIPDRISPTQFQQMIRQYQADDTIKLQVMRSGVPVEVSFTLCQGQALSSVYISGGSALTEAFRRAWVDERQRLTALLETAPGDIDAVNEPAEPVGILDQQPPAEAPSEPAPPRPAGE